MLDPPEIVQTRSRPTAVIRLTIPREEIRNVMGPAIGEVMAAVQAQGIAVDTVDRWGFEPEWLTPRQKADARRAVMLGKLHPYSGERLPNGHYLPKVYNFVRLKDGGRVKLDPMLEAV